MPNSLILASQSPRRAEILSAIGVEFTIAPSSFDEDQIAFDGDPQKYVCTIAEQKALIVSEQFPNDVVIAADTTVYCKGHNFGKPPTKEEAIRYLKALCGSWHSVFTGLSVIKNGVHIQQAEETKLFFNPLSEKEIDIYLSTIDWRDKAGGYAIQTNSALLLSKIDGCFYNAMGLPVNSLQSILAHFGINLWDFFARQRFVAS